MNLQVIEARLLLVLQKAHDLLPNNELADMEMLTKAGEPGVALENFCTQIEEYGIRLPAEVAKEVEELAQMMGLKMG